MFFTHLSFIYSTSILHVLDPAFKEFNLLRMTNEWKSEILSEMYVEVAMEAKEECPSLDAGHRCDCQEYTYCKSAFHPK